MARLIDDPERADRLARAICADLRLYHWDALERVVESHTFPGEMAEPLEEGRALFDRRVSDEIRAMGIFERAVDEVLLANPEQLTTPSPSPRRRSAVERSNTGLILAILLCFGIAALLWYLR
jgi:hypothetical protein